MTCPGDRGLCAEYRTQEGSQALGPIRKMPFSMLHFHLVKNQVGLWQNGLNLMSSQVSFWLDHRPKTPCVQRRRNLGIVVQKSLAIPPSGPGEPFTDPLVLCRVHHFSTLINANPCYLSVVFCPVLCSGHQESGKNLFGIQNTMVFLKLETQGITNLKSQNKRDDREEEARLCGDRKRSGEKEGWGEHLSKKHQDVICICSTMHGFTYVTNIR